MAIKHKWLKALALVMMASASVFGAVDPKEIEDIMEVMNATQVEFTLRKEIDKGDGIPPLMEVDPVQPEKPQLQRNTLRPVTGLK
jgi:hypothetical protein